MRESLTVPHYYNVFPTGHIPIPVCIGDMPMSDYAVPQNVFAETVATHMQRNNLIPGVIVLKSDRSIGVIPRHKMFERLGKRYGVELFLRKPIGELESELEVTPFILKHHLPINVAVKLALSRSEGSIYDPIVVEYEDGSLSLLDMYVLLLTQSQLSTNLSGIISSLNNIETILANGMAGASTLNLILESMGLVVPYHHARIIMQHQHDISALASLKDTVLAAHEPLERNDVYRSILSIKQPLSLEDVRVVPTWTGADAPSITRSWMGIPLSNQNGTVGLVTLSRFTYSPFTSNEKELGLVFTRYISALMADLANRAKKTRSYEKLF